jgi:A/G-specific adenine glycosylase
MAYALQSGITQDKEGKVADIEELCSKCEAIPKGEKVQVTDFPFKVKKQEIPKVTDVVCVVKFRAKSSSSSEVKTKILIRKRPAKGAVDSYACFKVWMLRPVYVGLLAGLWDFPVVPDVSPSPDSPAPAFESQACKLIKSAIPSCSSSGSEVQIICTRHIGSVEHVFSHVRKTFQTVIVELESEKDEEPEVEWSKFVDERQDEDDDEGMKKPVKKKRKFDKPQGKEDDGEEKVKWIVEDEVANAKYALPI